jgi:hypothetical protein
MFLGIHKQTQSRGVPLIHLVLLVMNARAAVSEVEVFVEMPVWTVASCGMPVAV